MKINPPECLKLRDADRPTAERLVGLPSQQVPEADVKAIFGQGSDARLANVVAVRHPEVYRSLRRRAVELGLVGVKPIMPAKPTPPQADAPTKGEISLDQLKQNAHRVEAEGLAATNAQALADPEIRRQLDLPPAR